MPDIVISEFMDEAAVRSLGADFAVLYDPTLVDRSEDLSQAVADCRGLIVRNRTQVRGALLDACRQLRVVGRLGVGLDNIDVAACRARNIEVMPATGANAIAVAEYVIAGLLMLLRGAYHEQRAMLEGRWPRQRLMGRELFGRRLGLIGYGLIAREVAQRARAMGMTIAAYDPVLAADHATWQDVRRHAALGDLLADSDALSLHVPLTDATRRLIDAQAIAAMKPGAVLINSSRGGVVDERALAEALNARHLGGAMLDVFECEPLPADSVFVGVPNLILTPHIAGVSEESNRRVSAVTADNVRRVLSQIS